MSPTIHHFKMLIHEGHLDTFGHVNNAAYLQIFEEARWDLITKNGYGLTEVLKHQRGPTILELKLKFIKEIRNRELITIETTCPSYEKKIGKLLQNIINENSETCCEMEMIFGLFDMRERKLILPTVEWKRAVGLNP